MMVFDVDFAFCGSCFVSDIQHVIVKSTMNYEIGAYISGNHVVKNFEVDYFKNEKSVFVCCFDNLLDGMHHDVKNCCHYNRMCFFCMRHDNTCYKTKKCYQYYRRSIRSLWKYYLRFIC